MDEQSVVHPSIHLLRLTLSLMRMCSIGFLKVCDALMSSYVCILERWTDFIQVTKLCSILTQLGFVGRNMFLWVYELFVPFTLSIACLVKGGVTCKQRRFSFNVYDIYHPTQSHQSQLECSMLWLYACKLQNKESNDCYEFDLCFACM